MELRVSNLEAAATLDSLLDRVKESGEPILIERDGQVAGKLVPVPASTEVKPTGQATVRDLMELLRTWEPMDDGWAEAVEDAIRVGNTPLTEKDDPWAR
jgi:antitoxin (DNA-binding transcriptional repressor) of toxin-antitoxin stability system